MAAAVEETATNVEFRDNDSPSLSSVESSEAEEFLRRLSSVESSEAEELECCICLEEPALTTSRLSTAVNTSSALNVFRNGRKRKTYVLYVALGSHQLICGWCSAISYRCCCWA